jgi:hypothetical protein
MEFWVHLFFLYSWYWGREVAGREDHHLPPATPRPENAWRYIFTSRSVFIALFLINYRDRFISTFTPKLLKVTK